MNQLDACFYMQKQSTATVDSVSKHVVVRLCNCLSHIFGCDDELQITYACLRFRQSAK